MGLTAVILTNRQPREIKRTSDSVSFADEVIIVSDNKGGIKDFSSQRNLGLAKSKNDWVLFVDDDEIVSRSLAKEISEAIESDKHSGYYLRRLDKYHGQVLRYGETGNTRIIRLAKKDAGRFARPVHETWQITGKVGLLESPLIHERGELVTPFIDRMVRYGPLDAGQLIKEGKPFAIWRLLVNPIGKFLVNYKFKLGFLDGYAGLFQAYLMSVQSLSVRVFQWQKH